MEKTEAVNKLKKAGYQVQFDSSVVTVLLEKKVNVTQEIKKLRSYLQEIGYEASFGVKQIRDDSVPEKNGVSEKKVNFLEEKEISIQDESSEQELRSEAEETFEIGEQFSLEDFGIN